MNPYKSHFPILSTKMNGHPLLYLDSAATTQKPSLVIDAIREYYRSENANVHRGVYALSSQVTHKYEQVRHKVRDFIHAHSEREIIFTKGATDGLNLVAQGYVADRLKPDDEIWTTVTEHHSNLIPWQQVAKRTGARLRFLPLLEDGSLDMEAAISQFSDKTKVITTALVSNVLGVVRPIRELARQVHRVGGIMVVDAAQAVPHVPVDVQSLECDFLVFSGHKSYGPTGIGILYGRSQLLDVMEPVQYGGEMIDEVCLETATWKESPWKFEAGTPPIAEVIGLGVALDYLNGFGVRTVQEAVSRVTKYAWKRFAELNGLTVYGPKERGSLIAFNIGGIHPHDVATGLDAFGIAVRAGQHCAQPLMRWLKVPSTVRVSFGLYNDQEDVDRLVTSIQHVQHFFR